MFPALKGCRNIQPYSLEPVSAIPAVFTVLFDFLWTIQKFPEKGASSVIPPGGICFYTRSVGWFVRGVLCALSQVCCPSLPTSAPTTTARCAAMAGPTPMHSWSCGPWSSPCWPPASGASRNWVSLGWDPLIQHGALPAGHKSPSLLHCWGAAGVLPLLAVWAAFNVGWDVIVWWCCLWKSAGFISLLNV